MIYTSYHCASVQCKITVTVLVLSEFVSTTDCLGPCLPNEMHFSTRQNSLSTRQCLCPLVQPVRLDNACVHSNDSTTDCLGPSLTTTYSNLLSLSNELYFSTRQYSLSTRQCLCPLVRLKRLGKRFLRSLLWTPCINLVSLANEMHCSTQRPSYKTRHKDGVPPEIVKLCTGSLLTELYRILCLFWREGQRQISLEGAVKDVLDTFEETITDPTQKRRYHRMNP